MKKDLEDIKNKYPEHEASDKAEEILKHMIPQKNLVSEKETELLILMETKDTLSKEIEEDKSNLDTLIEDLASKKQSLESKLSEVSDEKNALEQERNNIIKSFKNNILITIFNNYY